MLGMATRAEKIMQEAEQLMQMREQADTSTALSVMVDKQKGEEDRVKRIKAKFENTGVLEIVEDFLDHSDCEVKYFDREVEKGVFESEIYMEIFMKGNRRYSHVMAFRSIFGRERSLYVNESRVGLDGTLDDLILERLASHWLDGRP